MSEEQTKLYEAAEEGKKDDVVELLEKGVDLDITNEENGKTPLGNYINEIYYNANNKCSDDCMEVLLTDWQTDRNFQNHALIVWQKDLRIRKGLLICEAYWRGMGGWMSVGKEWKEFCLFCVVKSAVRGSSDAQELCV